MMIPDSSRLPGSHYQAHSRICDLIPKSGCVCGEKQGKGELGKVLLVESMTPRPLQEKAYSLRLQVPVAGPTCQAPGRRLSPPA